MIAVKLTSCGDEIRSLRDSATIDDSLGLVVQHVFCCGFVDFTPISKTNQAAYCRKCNFRFVFPKRIATWRELQTFVDVKLKGLVP